MTRLIALIRGINVGSTRKLPMAELRAACADAGIGRIATYIQSGNLILDHDDPPAAEKVLEELIRDRFQLDVPVVARTAEAWEALAAACPFPKLADDEPRNLHLLLSKRPPRSSAIEELTCKARDGETIVPWNDNEIAIHFAKGAGTSRLTPTLIDRIVGSPTTARNWNTVLRLRDIAAKRLVDEH